MRKVYVKERAFLSMVISAVEVYKLETLGLLLGYATKLGNFVVEYAIPYQTAEHRYTSVVEKATARERMQSILKSFPIDMSGDFHSHPMFRGSRGKAEPSGEDIADMHKGLVHMIVAINPADKDVRWHALKNGRITGTVGDYHLTIGAFALVGDYDYECLEVVCPSAVGTNPKWVWEEIHPKEE